MLHLAAAKGLGHRGRAKAAAWGDAEQLQHQQQPHSDAANLRRPETEPVEGAHGLAGKLFEQCAATRAAR